MNCNKCNTSHPANRGCYAARLVLALSNDHTRIVGTLDGETIGALNLREAVEKLETRTIMRFDSVKRAIVFENEKSQTGVASPDFVTSREILDGTQLSDIGDVDNLVEGAIPSVFRVDNKLRMVFRKPELIDTLDIPEGFLTYVKDPDDGNHLKLISPDTGGDADTVLIGHPDGSIEFGAPVPAPILIPVDNLTGAGNFSGAPAVTSGSFRYQEMGHSEPYLNDTGSIVDVTLALRLSILAGSNRSGVYCTLDAPGTDFKTSFTDGLGNAKQELGSGGTALYTVSLNPGQKVQFRFGIWENGSGNMTATLGSISETAGTNDTQVSRPIITVRRRV